MKGLQGRRQWCGIEQGKHAFGVVKPSDQQQTAHLEVARVRRVDVVAMLFERDARGIERLLRPAQIARSQRDLRFGDHAPRPGHRLARAERARSTPQQRLGTGQIAELRHRDATQRQRGRVVAQGNTV